MAIDAPRRALTVLIPFYNEAGNIQPLLDEVHTALDGVDYEIVCVNDCSDDATGTELVAAQGLKPERIKILTHVKRRGKSAALFTGLRSCVGDWVQLLDGDGQNDPADARRVWDLVAAKDENPALGIVCGRRTSRNDSGFKWLQSRIANGIRRFCLRDDATDTGCGFKLIRRRAFQDLPYFAAMHRFLPALIKRAGCRMSARSLSPTSNASTASRNMISRPFRRTGGPLRHDVACAAWGLWRRSRMERSALPALTGQAACGV